MSSSVVAEHYNNVKQTGIQLRTKSRIFYLRNFNNWIKSQLINDATNRLKEIGIHHPRILDIACGKGGDLRKWDIAKAKEVVMVDIADVSIEQAKERYGQMQGYKQHLFRAEFHVADCTKTEIKSLITSQEQFDLTSCQFAMHYSFVDEQSARTFLKNAVEMLKPGGIFIGTLPDADRIMWAVRSGENGTFENDVVKVKYENLDELDEGKTPLFGAKFHFTLDSQVNCPEFLAYFPLVKKLLEEMDMELLYVKNFDEAVEQYMEKGRSLIENMQGLETYPAPEHKKLSGKPEDYNAAKEKLESLQEAEQKYVGTLSKSEWEAVSMYLVFAFRKKGAEEQKSEN
ncbi:unnamed protein product [Caenorhabditis bovis]|uniref:mRNA cap guanine-N(7) methyltransferase n=1 Tax=Caenorhabditis bovis TaxID=2654633 RepID=A0A8S1F3C9_9PELO|nr:unnamed protein product [Caenorhabditis bovis]